MRNYLCLILFVLMVTTILKGQSQTIMGVSSKETSCTDKSAKIMILGTYHMDNPGLDAINTNADDVLLPKRQSEIVELIEKLARFNPTKIVIEAPFDAKANWDNAYKKYVAGEFKLGRNEIYQIGFRLAKRLNHQSIYPVDYPMLMSGLRYDEVDFSKSKPNPPAAGNETKATPQVLSEEDKLLRRSTITEIHRYMNNEEKFSKSHGENYLLNIAPDDKFAIYERADQVSNWYKRELRIFANINRVTEFPHDRILVLIGSGHLKIQRDFALDAPQFCLIDAELYLK